VNCAKSWKRLRNGSILSTPARANCRKYAQALGLIYDDSGGVRRGGRSISIRLERAICRTLTACVDTPGADSQHHREPEPSRRVFERHDRYRGRQTLPAIVLLRIGTSSFRIYRSAARRNVIAAFPGCLVECLMGNYRSDSLVADATNTGPNGVSGALAWRISEDIKSRPQLVIRRTRGNRLT
jgi:hypothetical protein